MAENISNGVYIIMYQNSHSETELWARSSLEDIFIVLDDLSMKFLLNNCEIRLVELESKQDIDLTKFANKKNRKGIGKYPVYETIPERLGLCYCHVYTSKDTCPNCLRKVKNLLD